MLRLLLVRHAEAAQHASQGDRERPLTAQGCADAARMGVYFRVSGLIPDRALVSPARRARDTLDAILRQLPQEPAACEAEASLYNAGVDTLLELLARTEGPVETLLVVGHNPGLGEFARFLVSRESALPRHFPAPCLAVIDFPCRNWSEARAGIGRLEHFVNFSGLPADDSLSDDSLSRDNENG
jgi:phosphohistidine phosphatase